jgi:hypothetical protein
VEVGGQSPIIIATLFPLGRDGFLFSDRVLFTVAAPGLDQIVGDVIDGPKRLCLDALLQAAGYFTVQSDPVFLGRKR